MSKMAYVGRCRECGVICAARMDDSELSPKHRKNVAADVAEMVGADLVVERVDSEQVRIQFGHCQCVPVQPVLL